MRVKIAVIGATGYSGREVVYWLRNHPKAEVVTVTGSARTLLDLKRFASHLDEEAFFPFRHGETPVEALYEQLEARKVVAAFLATEAETSIALAGDLLQRGLTVIDLSAAFRLKEAALYPKWYGLDHPAPELLRQAVYGLSEYERDAVARASLIANPGCYPTSILLALLPLRDCIDWNSPLICDSKSGLTGAGRNADYIFAEINENCQPYKLGNHRHVPEILQGLEKAPGNGLPFAFSPHLVPMNRGILSTCYFRAAGKVDEAGLRERLARRYEGSPFVTVMPRGTLPQVQTVVHTNRCEIGLYFDPESRLTTTVSSIDNLVKGAAGQAIQNLNLRFGFEESAGLR